MYWYIFYVVTIILDDYDVDDDKEDNDGVEFYSFFRGIYGFSKYSILFSRTASGKMLPCCNLNLFSKHALSFTKSSPS